ncbi:MAG TPA: hypothetical protein PKH07_08915, partial [bacterium]|nr:hypothetical protein [bacterium]
MAGCRVTRTWKSKKSVILVDTVRVTLSERVFEFHDGGYVMRRFLIFGALVAICLSSWADSPEFRGVYVPYWEMNTQAKCDTIIAKILARNINSVYIQVRGRGDAFYFPNRESTVYPNP